MGRACEGGGILQGGGMEFRLTLEALRALFPDAPESGNWEGEITGVAGLKQGREGDLSFLGNVRYSREVASSGASVILVPEDFEETAPGGKRFVRVPSPSLALALVCERIEAQLRHRPEPGVHPSAVIDSRAEVDPSATIGPLCVVEAGARVGPRAVLRSQVYLGRDAEVGEDSWLYPHVTVYRYCRLGARVTLHAGVVVGSDGFGYESGREGHRKVPQVGIVVIEDDVEIGANSTIDRARLEETRIKQGAKIDNLVQIAHNVTVGRHCFLCSQAGISGSTELGDFVVVAGQAGTVGHITIGAGSQVAGQAGVAKSLPPGSIVTGTPATEFQRQRRLEALVRRLPKLFERIDSVEKVLAEGRESEFGK